MSPYRIVEVDGEQYADEINRFNSFDPETFPLLKPHHLTDGFWWFAYLEEEPVAFAGMVPNEPYHRLGVGYLKRAYVLPDHRGRGLQLRLMVTRETKARQIGWTMLVSECHERNSHSANNFRRAGFDQCWPEQPWAKDSIFWTKTLA